MGQQQLLLVILGVIVVGVAVVVGITIYTGESIRSNHDNLMNDLHNITSDAYAYFTRANIMGGGNGTYQGYKVPEAFRSMADGDITETIASDGMSVTFVAASRYGYGTITTTVTNNGIISPFISTGDFQ